MTARDIPLLAAGFGGTHWILFALTALVVTILLRRAVVLGRRSRSRDPLGEVKRGVLQAEQTSIARMTQLEVRLHDYGREVEGRMDGRIAMLNQLVHEANRAIERLERLLEQGRQALPNEREASPGPAPAPGRPEAHSSEAA